MVRIKLGSSWDQAYRFYICTCLSLLRLLLTSDAATTNPQSRISIHLVIQNKHYVHLKPSPKKKKNSGSNFIEPRKNPFTVRYGVVSFDPSHP